MWIFPNSYGASRTAMQNVLSNGSIERRCPKHFDNFDQPASQPGSNHSQPHENLEVIRVIPIYTPLIPISSETVHHIVFPK